ncbi:Serine/threonine protein kinase [Nonomuraea solani]|uniref:Serine/threonine protein kinase n=1 Tax=Nonomuraea solani TaxID=1144553 RepID=A0A1H5SV84_9ACTN|nr:serine/threonine-protein kinase [Nonomuraea solani]SEF54502.1 Serine/threonine protein kinase [Nonomuraea solani]
MSELHADDPRQLGEYQLSRRLGQGGQGVVFLAHSSGGAQVAVKLLHAGLSGDPDVRRRFLGEVEAARRVAAFCTAQLLDADLDGDRPYLVSEYVEGPSLGEHVIDKGPRTGGSLERLAIGTATALGAIHRAGVVHRDFKPGNVLLSLDGPRVIDFGISRMIDTALTTSGVAIGTPAYLSPERIQAVPAGPPADLWAWGLTVAYTATGRHAYMADTYQEILARILYGKPDLRGLSGRLREIVEACLAHDPAERPDAEEVLRWLLGHDAETDDVLRTGVRAATAAPDTAPSGTAPSDTTEPGQSPPEPLPTADLRGIRTGNGETEPKEGLPPGRRLRAWRGAVAVAGLAVAVTGFVLWTRGDQQAGAGRTGTESELPAVARSATVEPTTAPAKPVQEPRLAGTWKGSAEHPTAKRIFPVELELGDDGGVMRWGSDLHCSGRLNPTKSAQAFALDHVKGDACHPGTLRIVPTADPNQIVITVTREGKHEVTYSGTVARGS